ncbi:MAG: RsmE family RNA methyltransferase [Endomicrobiia bacterium]
MTQFYFPELKDVKQQQININSIDEVKHIKKSYRAKVGDLLRLFDGKGCIVKAKIRKITAQNIILDIIEKNFFQKENFEIIICQGLIKIDRFELVLEKSTEIGVDKIVPLELENIVVKKEKFIKKYERFKKIILESAKQSNRIFLPEIDNVMSLEEIFVNHNNGLNIILYKNSEKKLKDIENEIRSSKKIKIFVGPEGDFSKKEIEFLREKNATYFINLTNNVLRSETAAIVALGTILQFKRKNGDGGNSLGL